MAGQSSTHLKDYFFRLGLGSIGVFKRTRVRIVTSKIHSDFGMDRVLGLYGLEP